MNVCPDPLTILLRFFTRENILPKKEIDMISVLSSYFCSFSNHFLEHEKDLICLKSVPDMHPIFT